MRGGPDTALRRDGWRTRARVRFVCRSVWLDDRRLTLDDAHVTRGPRVGRRMRQLRGDAGRRREVGHGAPGPGHLPAVLGEPLRERIAVDSRYCRGTRRNDGALAGRAGRMVGRMAQPRHVALTYRRDARRAGMELSVAQLLRVDSLRDVSDSAALYERGRRHRRDSARCTVVHVGVVDVRDVDVIDVVDVLIVDDDRLIDPLVIPRTPSAVARAPDFAGTEREPRYARGACAADG